PGGPREAERQVGSQDGSSRSLRRPHPVREPVPTLPSHFQGRCGVSAAVFGSCVRMVVRVALGPLAGSRVCHSPGPFSPLKNPENVNHELFFYGEVLFCFATGSHLVAQAGVQRCKNGSLQPRPPGVKRSSCLSPQVTGTTGARHHARLISYFL
uniref:Uncharacterized protein n=1 Tax=Cercocebus atys TaxID=9531 RepID=A0A2K5MJ16_CERAT